MPVKRDRAVAPSFLQLVTFLAAVFALGSLGIDAVLPSLSTIGSDLRLSNPNHAQFLVTSFIAGMGIGNLVGGPLSDAKGRQGVILIGLVLYAIGAIGGLLASSLDVILVARVVQGIGASLASVAATALVRDLYAGDAMARVMSFAMMVFAMMPAVAPFMGKLIASAFGWKAIFGVFGLFAGVLFVWCYLEMDDPAGRDNTVLSLRSLRRDLRKVWSFGAVRQAIYTQSFTMASLISIVTSIQPIFDKAFGRAESFPLYFALIALAIAISGFINGKLLGRFTALRLVRWALCMGAAISFIAALALYAVTPGSDQGFALFMLWAVLTFFSYGFLMGNLNALALQPVGELAGMASSLVASIPMIVASLLATGVGALFNGGPVPLVCATFVFALLAVGCISRGHRSRPRAAAR